MNSRITKSLLLIFPWIALALAAPIGCDGKGKKTADQVAVGTDGGQQTLATTVDCPNTSVVGADGKETAASPANLYRQYHGGTPTFLTNALNGKENLMAGNMGNYLIVVSINPPSFKFTDLRSGPILGLKWVESKIIVGTLSNLQVCSVPDPSQGVKVEDCKVYDRAGGVSDVDVLGDNIYFTTVSGDFGYISMSTMDSQSGCGRLLYSAAGNIHEKTKTPMRAFRVAAGADAAYFLTRNNSGDTAFNLNSLIANLMDWTDPNTFRAIKRETALYRYTPGSAAPEKVDVGDANYHYLMDDLVGDPDGKVHASFVAPREADVKATQDCFATVPPPAPCPGFTTANANHVALSYFLNSKQGLLSIQGNEVKHFEAAPSLNINANEGCSPDALANNPSPPAPPNCLRVPNIAFLFFNRLTVLADSVIMRGMFGFARLKGETFEVVAGFPFNNNSPPLALPFAIGADSINTYASGFFIHFFPLPMKYGMVEKGEIPPDLTLISTNILQSSLTPDDLNKNLLYAGSDQHAYVHADDSFRRIKFSDPTNETIYDILTEGGSDYTPAGLFPVAVQVNPPSGSNDRVVVFHEQNNKYILAFYEPTNPTAVFKSTPQTIAAPFGTVFLSPIAYVDDFVFVAITETAQHAVGVFDADWTAKTVDTKTYTKGDGYSFGILSVDKIPEGYRVYLLSDSGVSVLTFPYNSTTNIWGSPTKDTINGPAANIKGVTAGGGHAYFVMENGSVKVLDGSTDRTIPGAIALRGGEKVLVSITPRYVNGRLVIPALLLNSTIPTIRMATAVVDLNNEANKNTYELPFLFVNNYGDKFFGASMLNGVEAFDLSKPNTDNFKGGSIDLGGAKVSTPGGPIDAPPALEGEASGDTPTGNKWALGGGGGWTCNLSFGDQDFSVTSILNLMGWMLLIGAAISGWMLIRRKSS